MATVGEELERMENRLKKVAKKKLEEGRTEREHEIARSMKQDGVTTEMITKYTGLTEEDIEAL